jgi:hypothetical protein
VPTAFALHAPYPNPSDGRITIRYDVAEVCRVRVAVYDLLGREVAVLVNGFVEAGHHQALLDGARLPVGLYLVRMTSETGFARTQRVTLVR